MSTPARRPLARPWSSAAEPGAGAPGPRWPAALRPSPRRSAMRRSAALLPLALVWLGALGGGCRATTEMRENLKSWREKLNAVRADAYRCAPRFLAIADTAIEFAGGELDQGDMGRAKAHYREAEEYFDSTLKVATSVACKPPPAPPPPPPPVDPDRDRDGVPDRLDRCPDHPGPREWEGCPDSDGDGIPDHLDKCPQQPGPKENQGCPFGDRDGDGVKDNVDRCPDVPGPRENEGCPWGDKDGDGVPDNVDRCPQEPGPKENQGCPWPDRDRDGIPDHKDKCPDLPGVPELDGCPRPVYRFVEVDKKQIRIKQKIHFETGKAVIRPISFPILDEVAAVIKAHPRMRVRVEGHTDNRGGKAYNKKLSSRRANSVREYLVEQGIAPFRLSSAGYGLERPIESNKSKQGRAANRRVEFHILGEE